jgi:hypothetical protein
MSGERTRSWSCSWSWSLQYGIQPPACYWCKIIFHFQTWGIGFNLCPVSRLAKWKLVLVMQINAELQKADKQASKRAHTHARTRTHTRTRARTPGWVSVLRTTFVKWMHIGMPFLSFRS